VWGVGCGVWGFTDFQVVNYLIFREKGKTSLKVLYNKVFRFIQQAVISFKHQFSYRRSNLLVEMGE